MGITAERPAQITASGPPPYSAPPIKSLQQQPRAAVTAERSDSLVETLVDRGNADEAMLVIAPDRFASAYGRFSDAIDELGVGTPQVRSWTA